MARRIGRATLAGATRIPAGGRRLPVPLARATRHPAPLAGATRHVTPFARRVVRVVLHAAPLVLLAELVRRTGRGIATPGRTRARHLAAARRPLPSLFEVHPEARSLVPRHLGLRSVNVDEIVGTAVAGPNQRGGDFLPLRPFRSRNWEARWQRIRTAVDRLAVLPPVDLVKYGEGYWVEDGHNRVAAALHVGQIAIDAIVIELVAPGARRTEPPASLAPVLAGSTRLRTAGEGRRLAVDVERSEP